MIDASPVVSPPDAGGGSTPAPGLAISGRTGARTVVFPTRLLLAPMEGITERCFRDLVIACGGVGGACTEFIRISSAAIPPKVVRRELGPLRRDVPIGVQLMAPDDEFVPASVAAAEAAGAAWIDLNFGCPAPVVFDKCAGSALLARPELLARITAAAVAATELPVTVKVRAGIDSDRHLAEVVTAAAEAGAAMLTVHARLRIHSYAHPATWEWIAAAKAALLRLGHAIPLIGNGGIDCAQDVARMRAATGCDGAMIGRAALADPWIFSQVAGGPAATAQQAAGFALAYADALAAEYGEGTALARLKQLLRYIRAGDLFAGQEDERQRLLRIARLSDLRDWLVERGSNG